MAVPDRNWIEIEYCSVARSELLLRVGLIALYKCINIGISAIRCFKHSNAIKIHDRITFDFYLGLPRILFFFGVTNGRINFFFLCMQLHCGTHCEENF